MLLELFAIMRKGIEVVDLLGLLLLLVDLRMQTFERSEVRQVKLWGGDFLESGSRGLQKINPKRAVDVAPAPPCPAAPAKIRELSGSTCFRPHKLQRKSTTPK